MPKFYRYLFLLVLLAFLAFWAVGAYWNAQVHQPVAAESQDVVAFTIESGESGREVGQRLAEKGLIKSPFFLRLYLRLQNSRGTHIQAGEYQLSPSMSAAEIVKKISAGGSFENKVTFVEGWRVEEMAVEINSKLDAEEFLKQAKLRRGYLFPDTYFIDQKTTAAELIKKMRENFEKKYAGLTRDSEEQGLTQDEIVTFASIVEREAAKEDDRKKVAGILIKRWRNGWPLEADATVQFAKANVKCQMLKVEKMKDCQWWPKELTKDDLKIDSPYNTRANVGLPPTPISNPGLAALKAAANPQKTPYWYYLTDENGVTHYSKTLAEHNANITKYLR